MTLRIDATNVLLIALIWWLLRTNGTPPQRNAARADRPGQRAEENVTPIWRDKIAVH